MEHRQIRSFQDLNVYKSAYQQCLCVFKEILPKLPPEEKYDLRDQLSRSSKAVPRLIAEGYAKKHQQKGFQKYIDDALAESNETIVGLHQCRDLYAMDTKRIAELVDAYDKISRQLYKLAYAWDSFKNVRKVADLKQTSRVTENR